jgi:hypothetical protein
VFDVYYTEAVVLTGSIISNEGGDADITETRQVVSFVDGSEYQGSWLTWTNLYQVGN